MDASDSGISAKRCFKNGHTMLQVTHHWVPFHKAAARFGSRSHSLLGGPKRKWGKKKKKIQLCLINSVTIIGFVGADREQRSWKNTDDEWASKTEWHRVCVIWN